MEDLLRLLIRSVWEFFKFEFVEMFLKNPLNFFTWFGLVWVDFVYHFLNLVDTTIKRFI
jgi:hypothetical protein